MKTRPRQYATLRLPGLVLFFIGSCLLFLRALPTDPVIHERLTRPFRISTDDKPTQEVETQLAQMRANDTPLGTTLPLPPIHSQPVVALDPSHSWLILMIDACSECAATEIGRVDYFAQQYRQLNVVVVSPTKKEQLQTYREAHRFTVHMSSDPKGTLARRYNAFFKPRAYLLTASGDLLWRQPDTSPDLAPVIRFLRSRARQ